MHLAGITRATADREAVRQAVRGPAGERFAGGVRQIRRSVAGDGRTFRDLGALVDIAGADRPVVRDVADRRQLDALHALLARLQRHAIDGVFRVDLVADRGTEQFDVERPRLLEYVPLPPDLLG